MVSNTRSLIGQIEDQADMIVDKWAVRQAEATGKPANAQAIRFVKAMLRSSIDLIQQAIDDPGKINLRTIGMMTVKRALAIAGYAADEKSTTECVVSTMSLAIATTEYFEIMVGAVGMSATGEGAVIGVPIILSASFYYASQAYAWADQCGEAYVKQQESKLPKRWNFPVNSAAVRHKAMTDSPIAFFA